MRSGDVLRFRGPAGAPFVVTVGVAFTEDYIKAQVEAGEWSPLEDAEPAPSPATPTARKRAPRKPKAD